MKNAIKTLCKLVAATLALFALCAAAGDTEDGHIDLLWTFVWLGICAASVAALCRLCRKEISRESDEV